MRMLEIIVDTEKYCQHLQEYLRINACNVTDHNLFYDTLLSNTTNGNKLMKRLIDGSNLSNRKQSTMTSTLTNPSYQPTSVSYKSSKSIHGLQDQVDDVVQITRNNLILGLERGVKLDVLENRTGE
ncbi:unnamed protein product [Adineta steineri]|uniref:V-SNARE coiled-coil homology domain-containing protein n=1 Tax=Adineta steineri TaxID=433720 RepID=A0A819B7K4_9BILA|nr:unnamed protein product [Adineta steineri]